MIGFLGCLCNFGILVFNRGFTKADDIAALDPEAFSVFAQWIILVWGMAYFAADRGDSGRLIWLVFALEKAFFVMRWVTFHLEHPKEIDRFLNTLKSNEPLLVDSLLSTNSFFAIYGVVDGIIGLLFLLKFLFLRRRESSKSFKGKKE